MPRRTLAALALALGLAAVAEARTVSFSGLDWWVKLATRKVGPGPNYFADGTENVWVDAGGRLHLRIAKRRGRWYCAEVVSLASLGYGTYRFYLASPVDALDANVVLGLFTWSDDPAFANREMDVEMARWGDRRSPTNAQYVVQPYDLPGHLVRFVQPAVAESTHAFTWLPGSVAFQSLRGLRAVPSSPADVIAAWTFPGPGVPEPGDENARLNLWLFRGRGPSDGREVEVVVDRFEFEPAP